MTDPVPSGAHGNLSFALFVQPYLVLREIVQVIARVFPPRITVRAVVPADLWPIRGDPAEIHQALINVLLNARAAMPKRGHLILKAKNAARRKGSSNPFCNGHTGDQVEVAISHTGFGLYERPLQESVGVRLAHVARVLNGHGGFAQILSRAGRPTTLTLHFPRAEIAPVSGHLVVPPGRNQAKFILLVDDDETRLESNRQILGSAGYQVYVARDGGEAFALLMRCRSEIDLVLFDLAMPGMNGFTFMWALRRSNPSLRVMVATDRGTKDRRCELERLGVRQVLVKPFISQQLLDAVSRARVEPVQCEPDLFQVEVAANGSA